MNSVDENRIEQKREQMGEYSREDLDLRDAYGVMIKRWRLIALFTGLVTLLTLVVSLLLPPIYRATAVVLPINQSFPAFTDSESLSSLIGLMGMGGDNSSSKIRAILESTSIKERIIVKHDLMKVLFRKKWNEKVGKWKGKPLNIWEGIRYLEDIVRIKEDRKTGAISISTDFKDPGYAANISGWLVEELTEIVQEKSFSVARHYRENMEEIFGRLRGHLKAPEVDPPEFSVFMQRMQELEISEKAYEELLVQYYLAKFQEAKEDVLFQVIDEAKEPDEPERPLILVNTAIGFLVSLILISFYVVITDREKKVLEP